MICKRLYASKEDIKLNGEYSIKKRLLSLLAMLCLLLSFPCVVYALQDSSIVIATGQDVPTDDHIQEGYRFPKEYQDYAVQFVTEDGVALYGYVLGSGHKGVAIAHAKGWMLKSCLPFAERLANEGYQVILWEFRNTLPSGSANEGASQRWDLDVRAAVRVLRERGCDEIFCMGASYGGSATAVAATSIPELVGVAILSSPANVSDLDPISAMKQITVPAFFAVSTSDFQGAPGVYQKEVETLYEACPSSQKEIHILGGTAHGTDLITIPPEGELGYASFPASDEDEQARRELADLLVQFIGDCFSAESSGEEQATEDILSAPQDTPNLQSVNEPSSTGEGIADSTTSGDADRLSVAFHLVPIGFLFAVLVIIIAVKMLRRE